MLRHAAVMSSTAADATAERSATACTATLLSALPPMFASIVAPTLNSVQQRGLLPSSLQPCRIAGNVSAHASADPYKRFETMRSSPLCTFGARPTGAPTDD